MKVMTRPGSPSADGTELTALGVGVLTAAAAVATSTSYVLQPELPVVARDVGSSVPVIGVVAALPIGGYLFGLALLVPLADRVRSHRLISGQLSVLATGLLLAATAATPLMLGAGLFVSGLCASTGAQMSSLAGRYSEASRRGRAVGTVTAGISAGIVLGRVLGGTLADWWGWRAMLLTFATACLALALAAAAILPRTAMRPDRAISLSSDRCPACFVQAGSCGRRPWPDPCGSSPSASSGSACRLPWPGHRSACPRRESACTR